MGLLDKVKNLFTDEEEIEEEVPVEEIKKEEQSLPTFMREKIEKEEANYKKSTIENTADLARQIPKSDTYVNNGKNDIEVKEDNNNFKFPIFEENDFIETTRQSKQNILYQEQQTKKKHEEKKASEIYGSKKEKKTTPKFKATPIISPVYGILDKNYTKEEVKVNDYSDPLSNFEAKPQPKNNVTKVDFETVRKKAYGSLTDEIKDNLLCENCELLKEAKRIEQNNEQSLLYNMEADDYGSVKKDVSLEEAEENYYDFGVSYEPVHSSIDDSNESDVKIVNHVNNEVESEKIEIKDEVKTKPNVLSTLRKSMGEPTDIAVNEDSKVAKKSIDDLELTDDLFNLIDSMYEERNDD